jgi:uncharacterized protein
VNRIDELAGLVRTSVLPPVSDWHPALCGEIDICIRRDGTWVHEGAIFQRKELMLLFAGLLRREGQEYFLVTPVEKLLIQVEDMPFVITLLDVEDGVLEVMTNCGESVQINHEHPLQFSAIDGVQLPFVEVRDGLCARFGRSAWYALVELAVEDDGRFYIISGAERYQLPLEI